MFDEVNEANYYLVEEYKGDKFITSSPLYHHLITRDNSIAAHHGNKLKKGRSRYVPTLKKYYIDG